MMTDIHSQAQALLPRCIADRRWFHQHAELSFQEFETAAYIEKALAEIPGLALSRPTATSVMAVLKTGRPGRCLAIRADIDALPINEANELPYRSCNQGAMHACGHDGHAAILLNAVRLLAARREELAGELRFIFQHAEETPPGGAVEVIRAGVLEGVDEVFGLHLTSTLPTGKFGVCSGVLTSATDRFEIEITGKGGHSSMPQECVDPIVVGAQIIMGLQTVLSRSIKPSDMAVLSVCQANAGSAYNIIPGAMHLTGSVRSYDEAVRQTAEQRIRAISQGIAQAAGASVDVDYIRGYDSIYNDPALTQWARELIAGQFGPEAVQELAPIAPGDDFCYYDQVCPGFFLELGAANTAKGSDAPHHNARYRLDEDALAYGLEYTATLLARRCRID